MKVDLTDKFIAALKPHDKDLDYFDTRAKGLQIRVTPKGVKSWSVLFTSPKNGKRARLSIGTYPATPLATARTRAIEAHGHVESGVDPRALAKPNTGAMTVAMLIDSYLKLHANKLRTFDELRGKLNTHVLPIIGNVTLTDLHRRDLHRVLDPIKERRSPAMAMKIFTDVRAMLNWAVERGYLDHNPCAGMREGGASKPRERFLSEEEIALLWPALSTFKPDVEWALKMALVTGQRIGEVCGMMVSELDLEKGLWTIPAERSKNGHAHTVPLSDMALELINNRLPHGDRLIWRNANEIAQALNYRLPKLPVQGWRAHDLRRSCCSNLAKLGFSPVVIGNVVNHRTHTKAGVTLGVYVQYTFDKEKREALDAWAAHLRGIINRTGAKVVPLRAS